MRLFFILMMLSVTLVTSYSAENNTNKADSKTDEAIKKAMEKEKKYAKEQKFYNADEYDFKGAQVDPETIEKVPAIEPDYDFNMDEGVYSD